MRFNLAEDAPFDALAAAYGKGLLTPFTGAGLSYPVCPLWVEFVEALERAAGVGGGAGSDPMDMMRRASRAALTLRNQGADELGRQVRQVLYEKARQLGGGLQTPPAATALAGLWWPLVLTTNYDSLFLSAWNHRWVYEGRKVRGKPSPDPLPDFAKMLPVGRGRVDCQRILNSTRSPDNPLLWALQGFIPDDDKVHPLSKQLAIGHEEYRRQTHEAIHFRRAFAEIYRSRILLFLGSSLRESYLLDLFGEALELLGTIGHFHYALVPAGSVDSDFLKRRLQILAIEYPCGTHDTSVPDFLRQLKQRIDGPRPHTTYWGVKLDAERTTRIEDAAPDIAVVRGAVRRPTEPGVTIAVGAGRSESGDPKVGTESLEVIKSFGPEAEHAPRERIGETHVYRVRGYPIFVVTARDLLKSGTRARDAREVAPAVGELMENAATDEDCHRVDAMLFATGRGRTFPQHIALHEMVRGYCTWYATARRRIPLRIYVRDLRLLGLLEAGRVDLAAMTAPSDILRFWIETVADGDGYAPQLAAARCSTPLAALLEDYSISGDAWRVDLRPAPNKDHRPATAFELARNPGTTLAEFGVLTGSTLIFERGRPPPPRRPAGSAGR